MMMSFPVIANQLWQFVAPGLYRKEKRALLPFLLATPVLFIAGAALAYFVADADGAAIPARAIRAISAADPAGSAARRSATISTS